MKVYNSKFNKNKLCLFETMYSEKATKKLNFFKDTQCKFKKKS